MSESPLPRPARVAGSILVVALGAVLVLSVFALGWVAVRGAIAASNLRSAEAQAHAVADHVGDPAAAADGIRAIAQRTSLARELTSDPVWRVVEALPWVGPQLSAVSTLAASADDIAGGLTPLVEVASTLTADSMRPQGGRIDLTPFLSAHDAATTASATIGGAVDAVEGIATTPLIGPLRSVVVDAQETLAGVGIATESLANATSLLPPMLGADGSRNYLVLFQNNAEWRSLGGIAGSAVVVHTEGGTMQLVAQDYATAFPRIPGGVSSLDAEAQAIYGTGPAEWFQNVTQIPDFAVTGQLAHDMWEQKHGISVDGVLAVDPVALSYLLEATGAITLPDQSVLTSDNAVQTLLNDVYLRFPEPQAQNQFFNTVTSGVFSALLDGRADSAAMLAALSRAGEEHRLLLWSAHPDEQGVLADTSLAGGLPVTDDRETTFGVFLNDGTGSKMDFYQTVETSVGWLGCTAGASTHATGTARLTTTISNNAPATPLPGYITGAGANGVTPGNTSTVVYLYLPEGAELQNATLTDPKGGDAGFGGGLHEGRQVLSYETLLAPGESTTATIDVRFDNPTGKDIRVLQTPTTNSEVATPVAACL